MIVGRYEEDELTAIRAREAGRARPVDSPEEPTSDRRRGLRARARDKKEADPEGQAASEEDAVENEAGEDKAEREAG